MPEYIKRRPKRVPALDYKHPDLKGITSDMIEERALLNEPVTVHVKDIVAVGNHLMDHFGKNWYPCSLADIPTNRVLKHRKVLEKHSGMYKLLSQAGVFAKGALRHIAFKEKKVRLLQLPDGKYTIHGGVYRGSWAQILAAETMNAHVTTIEEVREYFENKAAK